MKERTPVPTSLLGIANKAKSEKITIVLLRKRVFTKSPVRENRTPGSVRGLSGNWQSYRNQLVVDTNDRNAHFSHKARKHSNPLSRIHRKRNAGFPVGKLSRGLLRSNSVANCRIITIDTR